MSQRALCSIYKSSRRDEMYLYVPKPLGLKNVPPALMEQFGRPVHVMDMLLTDQRKLARVETALVLESLSTKGWYLQLPPPEETPALTEFNRQLRRDEGDAE